MKIRIVIIYFLFGLLVFLYRWFFWDLVEIFTPFLIFIPDIFLLIAIVVFLIYSIVYAVKKTQVQKVKAYIPLLITVISIILYIFFPFTKTHLECDFKMNFEARTEIVEQIKTGVLKPGETNKHLVELPEKYKRLSKGGGEVAIENHNNHETYLFFTYRGVLDNYSGFLYNSDENAQEELSKTYFEVKKLCDSWYFCASQ